MYNLTKSQKSIARWLVEEVRKGTLDEEFSICWVADYQNPSPQAVFLTYSGSPEDSQKIKISQSCLDILEANSLLQCQRNYSSKKQGETGRVCVLTEQMYRAVDENFDAPDTSFFKHLTPLADTSNLDGELKSRCLPLLVGNAADAKLWDSAVRTAGVILEERLRKIGNISDPNKTGRALVNDVFGTSGTLAAKFSVSSEREGYRELYAGLVGAFRNPGMSNRLCQR